MEWSKFLGMNIVTEIVMNVPFFMGHSVIEAENWYRFNGLLYPC